MKSSSLINPKRHRSLTHAGCMVALCSAITLNYPAVSVAGTVHRETPANASGNASANDAQGYVNVGRSSPKTYQAIVEKRFKHTDQLLTRGRLVYNDHAYHVIELSDGAGFEMIANTELQSLWIIDRAREVVHEVKPDHELSETLNIHMPTKEETERAMGLPGQFDPQPCLLRGGERTGLIVVDGVELETWTCNISLQATTNSDEEQVVEQHFSHEHGRVMYSLLNTGVEWRLQELQLTDNISSFVPEDNLRAVSIEEFIGLVEPIGPYDDSSLVQ